MGRARQVADPSISGRGLGGKNGIAGSAVADGAGRSHEHFSPELNTAGVDCCVCERGVSAPERLTSLAVSVGEQHDLRFGFGVESDAGSSSGFPQQQPLVTCSTIGHAHDPAAQPPAPAIAFTRKAANMGKATAGVNWPIMARTATANRSVVSRVNNFESRGSYC